LPAPDKPPPPTLDRLLHHAHIVQIVQITGENCRLKDKHKAGRAEGQCR
jgi:hypothetical protein